MTLRLSWVFPGKFPGLLTDFDEVILHFICSLEVLTVNQKSKNF